MEYHRKQAKALVRAYRAGHDEAVSRAEAVLGDRAAQRFLLSDAQHVIAHEQGQRSWPDLVRSLGESDPEPDARVAAVRADLAAARAAWADRDEVLLDAGIAYVEGDPVRVRIRKRGRNLQLDDEAGAVARAGKPPGWFDLAREIVEEEYWLNVKRNGLVFLPAFDRGRDLAPLVVRVADASVALYQELLELE
jgi:hypothetical protein